jgi:hypothetical protein
MRRILGAALAIVLTGQAAPRTGVDDLDWMSGRWEAAGADGRWTEESWAPPRGGLMLGHSRSGRGDAAREFEFLRIVAGADGVPVYFAQPGGRPAVGFRLAARAGTSAVFENPSHDFPQRIRYVRDGETLTATISAIDGSSAMSWRFRRQ